MHAWDYNRSAEWQELELIFGRLLQHRNICKRRERVVHASNRPAETFMGACHRPTEAARFRVQKCAKNHQLIVAGVERFLRHSCAAHFRVVHTPKTPCALHIYMQTLIGVFFVHGKGNMHAGWWSYMRMKSVLLRLTPSLIDRSKLKGQYTDVKSCSSISVGPSLKPHSLS